MKFGITIKPDHRYERSVDLAQRAEANGFEYAWMFDSHVLWRDPYPLLTLIGAATERLRLGTCVTNPATRDVTVTASALATLNEISGGRMDCGIGRGDSARRVIGKPPVTLERLEVACRLIRDLVAGRTVDYEGAETQLKWAEGKWDIPIWIAAYGPKALRLAGRIGDGVILQLAD